MRQKSVGSMSVPGGDVAAALRRRWSSTADGTPWRRRAMLRLRRSCGDFRAPEARGPIAETPRGAYFPRGSPTSACKAARWAVSSLPSLGIGLPVPAVGFKNADFWRPHRLAEGLRRAGGGVREGRWALIGVSLGAEVPGWLQWVSQSRRGRLEAPAVRRIDDVCGSESLR